MHPAIMQTISAQRSSEVRAQAAAWRRAREAGAGVVRARGARIPVVRRARKARALAGRKRLHRRAAA